MFPRPPLAGNFVIWTELPLIAVSSFFENFYFWTSAQSFYIDLSNYSLYQVPDSNVQRSWKTDAKNARGLGVLFSQRLYSSKSLLHAI